MGLAGFNRRRREAALLEEIGKMSKGQLIRFAREKFGLSFGYRTKTKTVLEAVIEGMQGKF